MKKFFLLFLIIGINTINPSPRLIFYLDPAPSQTFDRFSEEKFNQLSEKTPSQINKKLLEGEFFKNRTQIIGGFLAIYSGYIDFSNIDGQIFFPLKHTEQKLYLVITPKINLINVKGNTFSHQEVFAQEKENTKIYLFEKKQDESKQYYWQVTNAQIPENNIINPLSVVLLTKAKNIYVTLGDFRTNDNAQMILPRNIYAINDDEKNNLILNFMSMKRYFEPTQAEEKSVSNIVTERLIQNN
ncbi:hypothetical protein KJ644_00750 [Candidatus Dependentiae bacterium]|nr:hypothetical protein [Candidatus Dependentiae bacterium]MBU4386981.1 hypothetical protein [Candidatus Dependentiae bacterium]MCG2756123.1 hypothetical protein [Candidatus Dependentiae bacterium]